MRISPLVILAMLVVSTPALAQRLEIPESGPGRLRAARVRYDARTQTFDAEGDVVLTIGDLVVTAPRLQVDQRRRTVRAAGGVLVRQQGRLLRGGELLYEIGPRLAHVSGDVRLEQDGTTVTAARMRLNIATQVVEAGGGVHLARERTTLTGDEMVAHLAGRQVEMTGRVVLVRPAAVPATPDRAARALAAQETTITAGRLRYAWETHDAEAEGAVEVRQPDRIAQAATVRYAETRGVVELIGNVEIEQRSGEWLVEGGVIGSPRDAEGVRAVAAPVRLWADRVLVRLQPRDMQADGHVRVEQEGRVATGERAAYTARDQTIVVSGNVRLREADGSWLRAEKVIIAVAEETFEATGNVETEFPVGRGK